MTTSEDLVIVAPSMEDFKEFSQIQKGILTDVQKIDKDAFRSLIEKGEIMICKNDATITTGFAIIQDNDGQGLLRQLGVVEEYRRSGVASKLVVACETWFHHRNSSEIEIWVKSHNQAAIELYQKHGYVITSERHQFVLDLKSILEVDQRLINLNYDLRPLEDNDETEVVKKYQISPRELASYKEVDSSISIEILENFELRGFLRLRPSFPVLTPIILDQPNHLIIILSLIKTFLDPKFDFLKITIENEIMIKIMQFQMWADLNFILVKMTKSI